MTTCFVIASPNIIPFFLLFILSEPIKSPVMHKADDVQIDRVSSSGDVESQDNDQALAQVGTIHFYKDGEIVLVPTPTEDRRGAYTFLCPVLPDTAVSKFEFAD